MSEYFDQFRFCPKCGSAYNDTDKDSTGSYKCSNCQFRAYVKSFPTVTAVIPNKANLNEILMARRTFDPGKGELDTPGGFVNYGEEPEQAILRELKEELGIDAEVQNILHVGKNTYEQSGISYPVINIVYLMASLEISQIKLNLSENNEIISVPLQDIKDGNVKLIWPSVQRGIENYWNLRYHSHHV